MELHLQFGYGQNSHLLGIEKRLLLLFGLRRPSPHCATIRTPGRPHRRAPRLEPTAGSR